MTYASGVRAVVAAGAAAVALAACGPTADGAGEDAPIEAADSTVEVTGQDNLTWDDESLTASAGLVEVVLNCGVVNHNVVIDETGEEVVACRPGETRRGAVELAGGEYTFVCAVPGHERTMRGTLTVVE